MFDIRDDDIIYFGGFIRIMANQDLEDSDSIKNIISCSIATWEDERSGYIENVKGKSSSVNSSNNRSIKINTFERFT